MNFWSFCLPFPDAWVYQLSYIPSSISLRYQWSRDETFWSGMDTSSPCSPLHSHLEFWPLSSTPWNWCLPSYQWFVYTVVSRSDDGPPPWSLPLSYRLTVSPKEHLDAGCQWIISLSSLGDRLQVNLKGVETSGKPKDIDTLGTMAEGALPCFLLIIIHLVPFTLSSVVNRKPWI